MTAPGPAGRPVRRLPATTAIQLTLTVLVGQALRQNLTTRKQLETSTWTLSLERLRTDAPAAVQLLQLAAFLAPEPIRCACSARTPTYSPTHCAPPPRIRTTWTTSSG